MNKTKICTVMLMCILLVTSPLLAVITERYVSQVSGATTNGGSSEAQRDAGTGATWSSGAPTIDLTADSPVDLSAVVTSGANQDVIYLAGATGGDAGAADIFLIATVNDGADTLTVATNPTNTEAGGAVWTIGGPWTLGEATTNYLPGNRVNVLSDGTYAPGSVTCATDASTTGPVIFRGYDSTIGDLDEVTGSASFPDIAFAGGIWTVSGDGITLQNFDITGSNTNRVIYSSGRQNTIYRVKIENTASSDDPCPAIRSDGDVIIKNCYIKTNSTETTVTGAFSAVGCALMTTAGSIVTDNYIDSTRNGISISVASASGVIDNNVIASNSAVATHGIYVVGGDTGQELYISSNSIYQENGSNSGDGVHLTDMPTVTGSSAFLVANNIIEGWGAYALDTADSEDWPLSFINNATYNNSSGVLNLGDNPVMANIASLALSGSPFTDAANGDFTLDNTAGQGAVCREGAVNYALDYGGTAHNDKRDLGAAQSAGAAAGGGGQPTIGGSVVR